MINGLEGIPGSGKSYEAVAYHVLGALQKGRKVITNLPLVVEMFAAIDPSYPGLIELRYGPTPVRGTWDAERKNAFELFEDGRTEKAPDGTRNFGHVWDFYDEWKHPDSGMGPLFVVDECHVALPKMGTRPQVIEWFKLHRHFNTDVLLMTQSFRDMNPEIAGLLATVIKCRKADILGRKDCYIRKVHGGYRGAEISREERPYKPQFFKLYRSHTQGNSVGEAAAQDVTPFLVNWRRLQWVVLSVALGACVYAFWPSTPKPKAAKKAAPPPAWLAEAQAERDRVAASGAFGKDEQAKALAKAEKPQEEAAAGPGYPEPYAANGLHITARIRGHSPASGRQEDIYVFMVSFNGVAGATVTAADLIQAGYQWKPLTDCAGVLTFGKKQRAVICDSPKIGVSIGAAPAPAGMATSALPSVKLPGS